MNHRSTLQRAPTAEEDEWYGNDGLPPRITREQWPGTQDPTMPEGNRTVHFDPHTHPSSASASWSDRTVALQQFTGAQCGASPQRRPLASMEDRDYKDEYDRDASQAEEPAPGIEVTHTINQDGKPTIYVNIDPDGLGRERGVVSLNSSGRKRNNGQLRQKGQTSRNMEDWEKDFNFGVVPLDHNLERGSNDDDDDDEDEDEEDDDEDEWLEGEEEFEFGVKNLNTKLI